MNINTSSSTCHQQHEHQYRDHHPHISIIMNLSIYLSTGDHYATGLVIPAVPSMIDIMSSEHFDPDSIALKEQICWAIGNIAGI